MRQHTARKRRPLANLAEDTGKWERLPVGAFFMASGRRKPPGQAKLQGDSCPPLACTYGVATGICASTVMITLLKAGVLECGSAWRGTRTFASG